ncbi:collagen alpha-6(VI) chain-like [Stylophora pistillata]|uniref:collagen alpha-6(VI) chain-like n=1 Tax=Stylophora pistillata TaxID=50429 RepID=UPI000C046692|nr:collagen alpha-6(VI) chain-like [Stylophora pistillata]
MFGNLLLISLAILNVRSSSHIPECPVAMDVAFMIDVSGSITLRDMADLKTLISKVISQFVITVDGAHLALMTFADKANDQYYFKDEQNVFSIQEAVSSLSHPGGGSNMDVAFEEARRLFSEAAGGRAIVTRVLVIATDADFYDQEFKLAVSSSQLVKDDGIIIIGLGISSKVKPIMLKALASSVEQILLVPHSASSVKKDITGDLISMICEVARKPEAIVSLRKEGSALQGHVIKSMYTDSVLLCALTCLNTRNCFSFNYKMNSQHCELNHTNRLTSADDLILNRDSAHYEMVF